MEPPKFSCSPPKPFAFHRVGDAGETFPGTYAMLEHYFPALALDTFNTAVVSPIYYVMFTSLTILASVIMFKDWDRQSPTQVVTEMCGFVTILSGTFLLHKTKDMADGLSTALCMRLSKHSEDDILNGGEGIPLRRQESFR